MRCGSLDNLQCSHVASRKNNAGRWDEHNALTLCVGCHLYWWHKEPVEASEWIKQRFPAFYERSLQVKQEIFKPSLEELLLLRNHWKNEVERLAPGFYVV